MAEPSFQSKDSVSAESPGGDVGDDKHGVPSNQHQETSNMPSNDNVSICIDTDNLTEIQGSCGYNTSKNVNANPLNTAGASPLLPSQTTMPDINQEIMSPETPCQIYPHHVQMPPDGPEWRPSTKTWQQISIGMFAFGMELCYATETALLVPILLQLGLPEKFYTITWLVSPLLGFLMQPLIGRCH